MRRKEYEITNTEEIKSIIREAEVCRIALHDEPYPYIVPLNFGMEEGSPLTFYFHSAKEGKKIALIRKNPDVCFEIEGDKKVVSGKKACDWSMQYKSIIGFGTIQIVEDDAEREHGLNILMNHYSKDRAHDLDEGTLSRTCVLKLMVEEICGKQHGVL
jgi:nitroimidazol reductase NimA-like FMN-containing flavoprotein (pyridoxamine 5'-phosphate oxidase superfamily)